MILFDSIITHFKKYLGPIDLEWESISEYFEYKEVKRREFLVRKGEFANFSIFVLEGCLRMYSIDKDGVEHIMVLAPKEWWVGDMYSMLTSSESELFIDSIKPSKILILSRENQLALLNKHIIFERYFRILLENHTIANLKRIRQNMEMTARERYEYFSKTYPMLVETIPQKMIASFIGITPEFMSKMLKDMRQ